MRVRCLPLSVLLALCGLLSNCNAGSPPSTCVRPGGCGSNGPCCTNQLLCTEQICEGKAWTCKRGADGKFFWDTSPCPVDGPIPWPDQSAPRDAGDDRPVAQPDRPRPLPEKGCPGCPTPTKPCGPCNLGKLHCKSDCSGYETDCKDLPVDVCTPSQTRNCGNCNKGTQTCGSNCTWGTCNGQPCAPGSKATCPNGCGDRTCDSNCNYGGCSMDGKAVSKVGKLCWSPNHCAMGVGACVDCWYICDSAGNLHEDGWCAGGNCQTCPAITACP
jgi:hypothetical protein